MGTLADDDAGHRDGDSKKEEEETTYVLPSYTHMKCEPSVSCGWADGTGDAEDSGDGDRLFTATQQEHREGQHCRARHTVLRPASAPARGCCPELLVCSMRLPLVCLSFEVSPEASTCF